MFISKRMSRATAYHTDADCPRLRAEPTEITQQAVEWHELDCCEWCSNGDPASGPQGPNQPQEYVGLSEGEWP